MNLKELSEHLDLSQTTVSRALNGYPEVNEKTRQRVLEAARKLNYAPNTRAKSLATGRAYAIGHVIPVSTRHEIVNPIFGDFLSGAGEVYSAKGYELILSIVPDNDQDRIYRAIKTRGSVDGVIVQGPARDDARIPLLTELGLPFVVHGRSSEAKLPYSYVDVNNARAFEQATEYLIGLGHRRIALINGLEFMDFAWRRRRGYLAALDRHGITPDPALMRGEEMTELYGYRSAADMLASDNPPTAFLVSSMIAALGVRRAIDGAGLVIGRDVSVVTHDDMLSYLRNGEERPIFTATRSSVREAGKIAAEMLIRQIETPMKGVQTRLLESDLLVGNSTGPAPERT